MCFRLITCEVFAREMGAAIGRSPHEVHMEMLSKGLHEIPCFQMRDRIQEVIDRGDESGYDAVLLGYGLCSNGLSGIVARTIPVVLPRAHDCITLLLGSKERYLDYFHSHPGTYFKSSGWIEHEKNSEELNQLSIARQSGMDASYEELVEKYGEDNARYLYEELCEHTRNYGRFTFIEMGIEPDDRFERQTREEADRRGWKFEKVKGDLSLIQRMLDGDWGDEDFLVVPPGSAIAPKHDEQIVTAEKISPQTDGGAPRSCRGIETGIDG
ncbi:MAG: DUF1638 domain-containing protein, partial [Verrucomicrobiales bacterium]